MNDDNTLRALTVELASAAPEAPPMPDLDVEPETSPWRGPRLALAIAVIAIALPVAFLSVWTAAGTRSITGGEAADTSLFEAAGGTPVAIVGDDDTVLRGYLWPGSSHAVVLTQGFGSDATDILPIATTAADVGATVLLFEPRGTGQSTGIADPDDLAPDMRAVFEDLKTRGIETVSLMAFNHSGTASIQLAAAPPDMLVEVVAVFPFARYQSIDATEAIEQIRVPVTLVGVGYPSPVGPEVFELSQGSDLAQAINYDHPGEDTPVLESTMPDLIEIGRGLANTVR